MPATNELLQEGRYRIDHGVTGSDNVFEAYDTVRNTPVVVREIPVKLNKVMTASQQESLKIAFTNQAKALQQIEHDSLLPVHDFFCEIDRQYLVMEAVEGQDLAATLAASKRPFPVTDITRWADELLDALNYLHTSRPPIIHRNIRPQNLKLSNGKVKLFGVGLDGGGDAAESEDLRYSPMEQIWPGLDVASQKVITNSYDDRSERILKEPLDARSDIYALGATLYFLATGCEPVDPLERSIDILEGKLDPLREPTSVNSQIAPEISDVLMKALEIKRENRYDSALIMRQVLQSAIVRFQERLELETAEEQMAAELARQAKFAPPPAPPAFEEPPFLAAPPVQQKVEAHKT
jgi:serine/threonine protein kinase